MSATITFLSALGLIPLVFISYQMGITNIYLSFLMLVVTLNFVYQSYELFKTLEISAARRLMFGSFYFLPIVQILLVIAHYVN